MMLNHCLASFTTTVTISIIITQAFVLQCHNCHCLPDYCPQTIPQSLCPCGGMQVPCRINQATAGMQIAFGASGATNILQHALPASFVPSSLVQQPSQSSVSIPSQLMIQGQQFMQRLTGLQQPMVRQQPQVISQLPKLSPVYVIRAINQPGQVVQQIQVPNPMPPSQYISPIQHVPMQQIQMMMVPSVQQMIVPQEQQLMIPQMPLQAPMEAVTLQVPVTMAESCTPRANACPVGMPSIHAVTECDNSTESTVRCITPKEAEKLYTCLPHFDFNKLWG